MIQIQMKQLSCSLQLAAAALKPRYDSVFGAAAVAEISRVRSAQG
jgi:hypothetical protein